MVNYWVFKSGLQWLEVAHSNRRSSWHWAKFMTQHIVINKHSDGRVLQADLLGKLLLNKQAVVPEKFRNFLKERVVIY